METEEEDRYRTIVAVLQDTLVGFVDHKEAEMRY
jgi:hypothetical protein